MACALARARRAVAPLAWRRQTFWCLSDPPPTPWLTIAECLGFVSGTYPGAGASAEALRAQVEALGLTKALATPLRDASLGQQRKTLLALALALPVKLLLLDEPFNALDAASAHHLAETLTARAALGEQVILLTSHVEPHVPRCETRGCSTGRARRRAGVLCAASGAAARRDEAPLAHPLGHDPLLALRHRRAGVQRTRIDPAAVVAVFEAGPRCRAAPRHRPAQRRGTTVWPPAGTSLR